jgi:L-alanine-DL-glutamate epimerase-like enolase superfamily enzyme
VKITAVRLFRAHDRISGADPGSQPVLPPEGSPPGRWVELPGEPGLGIELDPSKLDERHEVSFEE